MRMIGSPVPATMYLIFTPLESKNWSLASAMQGSRKSKLVTATRVLDFTCAHPLLSDHSYFGRVTAARHGCRSFKFPFIFPGKLHLIGDNSPCGPLVWKEKTFPSNFASIISVLLLPATCGPLPLSTIL